MGNIQVLVCEDERIVAQDIQAALEILGYDVPTIVSTGRDAIVQAERIKPDLVLMDIVLQGDMNGIEAAGEIRSRLSIPVVYLTAHADDSTLEMAKTTEPFGYILKPFDNREMKSVLETVTYKAKMERVLRESQEWLYMTLKSVGDAVVATGVDGCVKFMNPSAEMLIGCNQADAIGDPLEKVLPPMNEDVRKNLGDALDDVLVGGMSLEWENYFMLNGDDERETALDCSIAPIRNNWGKIVGAILILRDINRRRQEEKEKRIEELKREVDSLLQASGREKKYT